MKRLTKATEAGFYRLLMPKLLACAFFLASGSLFGGPCNGVRLDQLAAAPSCGVNLGIFTLSNFAFTAGTATGGASALTASDVTFGGAFPIGNQNTGIPFSNSGLNFSSWTYLPGQSYSMTIEYLMTGMDQIRLRPAGVFLVNDQPDSVIPQFTGVSITEDNCLAGPCSAGNTIDSHIGLVDSGVQSIQVANSGFTVFGSVWILDTITFDPTTDKLKLLSIGNFDNSSPEPSTWALMLVGLLFVLMAKNLATQD